MKKTLISTALRIIPKGLQYKALCKALNHICADIDLESHYHQIIKLNVSDLKNTWFVSCDENGFKTTKKRKVNLEVKINLNTVMNLQRKILLLEAIDRGEIQFNGESHLIVATKNLLQLINEQRLINITNHFFSFLKIKSAQPARLDINNVKLSNLTSPLDINFIRDEALKLEKTDLEKALSLMLLAHKARPNGPLIARKVLEYKKILSLR